MESPRVRRIVVALLTVAGLSGVARADQIVLKNGDHITGKIDAADGGKLSVITDALGTLSINLADVKSFSTDGPIKIVLQDGTVINQKVEMGKDGSVMTAPGGTIIPQEVPLAKVAKINPPPVAWTGSLVVNGLLTRGDTSSEQLGLNLDLQRRTDDDRITLGAGYLFGRQKIDGVTSTTTDNWFISGKYDYFFTKAFYGYVNARVEKNRIQNLTLRLTPGAGVGYQWFDQPDFSFNTEGGVSWVYEDYSTLNSPNENVSIRLAYHLQKSLFDDKVKLFNNLQYFPSIQNASDYLLLADAGVRVALTKTMFSELKAEVDYDNTPAPDSHRTQVRYILGVGWTF